MHKSATTLLLTLASLALAGCDPPPRSTTVRPSTIRSTGGGGGGTDPLVWQWTPVWTPGITPMYSFLVSTSPPAVVEYSGHVLYLYRDPYGSLQLFDDLGFHIIGFNGPPMKTGPAAVQHDGLVDIAYVGDVDGVPSLVHMRWNSDTLGFDLFGGKVFEVIHAPVTATMPSIAWTVWGGSGLLLAQPPMLDVFWLSDLAEPRHAWRRGDTGRFNWDCDFNGAATEAAMAAPSAASSAAGKLQAVFTGQSGTVYHLSADFTGSCTNVNGCWSDLDVVTSGATSGATLAASGSSVDVFAVVGTAPQHWTRTWSGAWAWDMIAASCTHALPADMLDAIALGQRFSAPAATWAGGHLDLAVWAKDGNIWLDTYGYGEYDGRAPVIPPCSSCGDLGMACCGTTCSDPVSLTCSSTTNRCECGGRDEPCCASGAACGAGLSCVAGTCGGAFTATFDILKQSCASSACHTDATMAMHPLAGRMAAFATDPVGTEKDIHDFLLGSGLIVPSDYADSPLFQKIDVGGSMAGALGPDPTVQSARREVIRSWIAGGAGL